MTKFLFFRNISVQVHGNLGETVRNVSDGIFSTRFPKISVENSSAAHTAKPSNNFLNLMV